MRRVVITGMGIVSSIGQDIPTYWNNLQNGVNGITAIEQIPTDDLIVKIAGEVKNFNAVDFGVDKDMARRADRYTQFAMAAAQQAMDDSQLVIEPERLGVFIGSGVGGIQTFHTEHTKMLQSGPGRISPLFIPMMIANIASGNVAIAHHAEGPCLPIVTACATSTHSIGEAFRNIKHGYADAIIAGGAEAAITPISIGGFTNCKALSKTNDPNTCSLPFDARRQGFTLGEGSGVVILEEYEHAKARGAKIYAEVVGFGNTCDAYHYTAPHPEGKCAARAISLALQEGGYNADNDRIYINAHGTGTPLNDKSETKAIKIALGEMEARKALISSTKSMVSHMLGAAGAVELIASALTLQNGIVHPTINLLEPDPDCDLDYVPNTARKADVNFAISNSFGFGGQNACVALRKIND